jgi:hypothetical protein
MIIVGAGLAGLIAAHAFPRAQLVEAAPEPTAIHKALLRFRSNAVGDLCGVEFRPVTVRKGIFSEGRWQQPNIRAANLYAKKVTGRMLDRSIWSLEASTRWIAPETFYEQLLDAVGGRVTWGTAHDFNTADGPLISTAPLFVALRACGIESAEEFRRSGITVRRYRIDNADVFQTVYFPDPATNLYRASITGDLLICEFMGEAPEGNWEGSILRAFAVRKTDMQALPEAHQKYGKIAPINEELRKAYIAELTHAHNIFSLGRFATWRNILLDDVVHDIAVIRRLLKASSYERKLKSV